MADAYKVSVVGELSNEELVSWANVMADSFGRSDCPTLAAFRGVSYAEGKDHWRVGFRAKLFAAMGSALYFILPEAEGIALCFPPGTTPDSSRGGCFEKQYEGVLQANAEHYQYLKTKLEPGVNLADSKAWPNNDQYDNIYLSHICIPVNKRGQGRGKALMKAIQAKARELRCDIVLEADDPNNVAVYKHLGFRVAATAELPRIEGGSFVMWSMRWCYRGEFE